MKDIRPIYLDLFKIKFAIMAIVSILHRISGFILFLLIPLILWAVDCSLDGEQGFYFIKTAMFNSLVGKIALWLALSALIFHIIAGIRHLLMDWGWFESLLSARLSSILVFILFGLAAIFVGVWLW